MTFKFIPTPPSQLTGLQGIAVALDLVREPLRQRIPGVDIHLGQKATKEHGKPPRVVWVPSDDTYGPRNDQGFNPAGVATRFAGVSAHIWGKTLQDTETMLHTVYYTVYQNLLGSIQGGVGGFRGHWVTEEERVAGWTRLGDLYVLSFAVAIPVCAPALESTTIDGTVGKCSLDIGD
jgi:hypothetical protein